MDHRGLDIRRVKWLGMFMFVSGCVDDPQKDEASDAAVRDMASVDAEADSRQEPTCEHDEDCEDDVFCNRRERCTDGRCVPGPLACDDGFDCTRDLCDEAGRVCAPPELNDARCPQGQLCDPKFGCVAEPDCVVDLDCDDGLFCNGAERCDVDTSQCAPGVAPPLDDGRACTDDVCDDDRDEVLHLIQDARCDNGRFCDGAEVCDPEQGCLPGVPPVIDDGVPCTDDQCDEDIDRVTHTPVDARCEGPAVCGIPLQCDATSGCVPEGRGCTSILCDECTQWTAEVPVRARCANQIFCDGAEWCDPAGDCRPGVAPAEDQALECVGGCDEDAGRATPGMGCQSVVLPRTCLAILESGRDRGDGTYLIDPNQGAPEDAFFAECDMTGGGWTVVDHDFVGQITEDNQVGHTGELVREFLYRASDDQLRACATYRWITSSGS